MGIGQYSKADLVWMGSHKCKHGHNYLAHPNCFVTENPMQKRLGFLDIETSNLKANFGIVLCYKMLTADAMYGRTITPEELHKAMDKEIVKDAIEDMKRVDIVVTYYGTNFDIPFLRTRALIHDLNFPEFGELYHKDAYYMVKSKLCLASKRLEYVAKSVLKNSRKTHIIPEAWIRALQGNTQALAYIEDHCEKDVEDLRDVYYKVIGFVGPSNRSV